MRRIVTLKYNNDDTINIIGDASADVLIAQAIKLSPRLLGDKALYITEDLEFVKEQDLDSSIRIASKPKRKFMISFIMDNVVQVVKVCSDSPVGAYHKVRIKYSVEIPGIAIVYEFDQEKNKVSVDSITKKLMSGEMRIDRVLNKAYKLLGETPELEDFREDIVTMLNMIRDCSMGMYSGVDNYTMFNMISAVVYFVDPVNVHNYKILGSKENLKYIVLTYVTVIRRYDTLRKQAMMHKS